MATLTGRAARDANRVPVTYGVSSVDGKTVLPIEINPVTASTVMTTEPGVQAFCLAQSNF